MRRLRSLMLGISIFSLLAFLAVKAVRAQTTYESLLSDYKDSFDVYVETKDVYLEARANYMKYKTPVAADEAREATVPFLIARQKVLLSYLPMMQERLEQSSALTDDELKPLLLYIKNEEKFLESQIPLFDSANNLSDLQKLSANTEKRYANFLANAYKMKFYIIVSNERVLRNDADELVNATFDQVSRIRNEGVLDTTDMDRWISDAPERITFSEQHENKAISTMRKLSGKTVSKRDSIFASAIKSLRTSAQYLRESNNLLLYVIKAIRFQ